MPNVTYKNVLFKAIEGYNRIQRQIFDTTNGKVYYTSKGTDHTLTAFKDYDLSADGKTVIDVLTADELASAISNLAVIPYGVDGKSFVSGPITYHDGNPNFSLGSTTSTTTVYLPITEGYYPEGRGFTIPKGTGLDVSDLNNADEELKVNSEIITDSSSNEWYTFNVKNLSVTASHTKSGYIFGSDDTTINSTVIPADEFTDTSVAGTVGKIKKAKLTSDLGDAYSSISYTSSDGQNSTSYIALDTTNSNSGIEIKALAPTSAYVTIEAGYIEGNNYSVKGKNSDPKYLTKLKIGSGKQLGSTSSDNGSTETVLGLENEGTIYLKNKGTLEFTSNSGDINIINNDNNDSINLKNGTIKIKNSNSDSSLIVTEINGKDVYAEGSINGNSYTKGTQIVSGGEIIEAVLEQITYDGNTEITTNADFEIDTKDIIVKDDRQNDKTVKNINPSLTILTDDAALKDYEFYLPITASSTINNKINIEGVKATVTKAGWITAGEHDELTFSDLTISATGDETAKKIGVKSAIVNGTPTLEAGQTYNTKYTKKEITNSVSIDVNSPYSRLFFIEEGYISNSYFDIGDFIPDIADFDAGKSNILEGYQAYDEEGKLLTGTMKNYANLSPTLTYQGQEITINEGYYNGNGVITANIRNVTFNSLVGTDITNGIELVKDAEGETKFDGYLESFKISSLNIPDNKSFTLNMNDCSCTSTDTSVLSITNGEKRNIHLINSEDGNIQITNTSKGSVYIDGKGTDAETYISFSNGNGKVYIKDYINNPTGIYDISNTTNSVQVAEKGALITLNNSLGVESDDTNNSTYLTGDETGFKIKFKGTENVNKAGWLAANTNKTEEYDYIGDAEFSFNIKAANVELPKLKHVTSYNENQKEISLTATNYSATSSGSYAKLLESTTNKTYVKIEATADPMIIKEEGWFNTNLRTNKEVETVYIEGYNAIDNSDNHKINQIHIGGSATPVDGNISATTFNTTSYNSSQKSITETRTIDTSDKYIIGDIVASSTANLTEDATGSKVDTYLFNVWKRLNGIEYKNDEITDDSGNKTVENTGS